MAVQTKLAQVLNGFVQNIDLTADEFDFGSIKVGATALTQAILDNLVALQNGSDFATGTNSHTHDGRYYTESEIGSTGATSGADRVGVNSTPSNYSAASQTVQDHLEGIDTALGAVTSDTKEIKVSSNDTTPGFLEDKIVAGAGLSQTTLNDGANEDLSLSVNVDDATIEINTDTLRVKDAGITNAKVATGIDAAKLADGSVSNTEFQYLDGVTSSIQTQFTGKQSTSEKGNANGYASLDGAGKVPVAQLPSAVMTYEGVWNASTNSPTLIDGTGDTGMVYRVGTAGSQDLGSGSISFIVGDYVIYNGTVWEKSDTTDAVASVNGATGVVVLDTDDIAEGAALYFTDERAQDAVGGMLVDTATIDLTYNDGTPSITAAVKTNSIDETHLTASVAGDGLTGGNGTALAVGAGTGLSVAANAVNVDYAPMVKKSMIAGEAMAAEVSFLVRWAVNGETAGRVYKATNAAAAADGKFWAHGICVKASSVTAGDSVDVVMIGTHTLGGSDVAFNAADIGKAVWLTTAGGFSITAPTASGTAAYKVGTVESTTKIWMGSQQLTGIN